MDLATRIRDLRVRAGLTKTALAKPKYTVSFVSQIESGRRRPSPEATAFFAERLGVSAQYLVTGIPEDIEQELGYLLEEGRGELRQGRPEEAEALFRLAKDTVGDLTYAAELIESFLSRSERGPLDPALVAELQSVLVSIYFERGDIVRAERCARRALAVAAEAPSLEFRARSYWNASRILAEANRHDEALEFATRARVLLEEMGDHYNVARLHNAYAFICLETDPPRVREAEEHLDLAERLMSRMDTAGELSYVFEERGRLALLQGRPDDALDHATQALAGASGDELEAARCLLLKGKALAALGQADEAREALHQAIGKFRAQGARQQEASCWRELGELSLSAGDVPAAVQALRSGLDTLDPRPPRV